VGRRNSETPENIFLVAYMSALASSNTPVAFECERPSLRQQSARREGVQPGTPVVTRFAVLPKWYLTNRLPFLASRVHIPAALKPVGQQSGGKRLFPVFGQIRLFNDFNAWKGGRVV
jgi:hypothetical protein